MFRPLLDLKYPAADRPPVPIATEGGAIDGIATPATAVKVGGGGGVIVVDVVVAVRWGAMGCTSAIRPVIGSVIGSVFGGASD